MALALPPPNLVDRFRADVTALKADPGVIGLAVSGGPDSLALLLLAAHAFPGQARAATIDHRLRSESANEARFVAELCRAIEVPHTILDVEVDTQRASLQNSARDARYRALDAWLHANGIPVLATAHHADDQAETLMMRLLRGSGVGGLSSVRARTTVPAPGSKAALIRPLLGWRRYELAALVEGAGVTPVDDPSNRDLGYERVRIRKCLSETPWIEATPLARSASALAEADEALDWIAQRLWNERAAVSRSEISWEHRGLPAELKRRLLTMTLAKLEPDAATPRGSELGRLIQTLEKGGIATLAGIKCKGGRTWTFNRAPPRRARG
jgi:tRNA(Ile)-lysidine synthase